MLEAVPIISISLTPPNGKTVVLMPREYKKNKADLLMRYKFMALKQSAISDEEKDARLKELINVAAELEARLSQQHSETHVAPINGFGT